MDPSILFEKLTSTQNQCLGTVKRLDKGEFIAIILDVSTEVYCGILTMERKIKRNLLTFEDLERVMTEVYCQNTRYQKHTFKIEGKMLLFQDPGNCYNCGKAGYCAKKCTIRRINNSNPKD
jgi:hypothetical protein